MSYNLQAWVDNKYANYNGGVVPLPGLPGAAPYEIDSTLFLRDGIRVVGEGPNVSIITPSASFDPTTPLIVIGPSLSGAASDFVFYTRLEHLTINGLGRVQTLIQSNLAQEQCGISFCTIANYTVGGIDFMPGCGSRISVDDVSCWGDVNSKTQFSLRWNVPSGVLLVRGFDGGGGGNGGPAQQAYGIDVEEGWALVEGAHFEMTDRGVYFKNGFGKVSHATGHSSVNTVVYIDGIIPTTLGGGTNIREVLAEVVFANDSPQLLVDVPNGYAKGGTAPKIIPGLTNRCSIYSCKTNQEV